VRLIEDAATAQATLGRLFAEAWNAVVFTGAGVSTESGIPDFRSPGGVWSRMRPITFDEFVGSEAARLEDWRHRFQMIDQLSAAAPNATHIAIARLVERGVVRAVITQNIDGLHQRAGVPDAAVIELHGNATRAGCLDCGMEVTLAAAKAAITATGEAPRCPGCGALVKTRIISFGQAMPVTEMQRAEAATLAADLFVVAGSSLVVYPAAGFPMIAMENGATLVICNREPTDQDDVADIVIRGALGNVFRRLAAS
jgi:NAD-dependent deacetylase